MSLFNYEQNCRLCLKVDRPNASKNIFSHCLEDCQDSLFQIISSLFNIEVSIQRNTFINTWNFWTLFFSCIPTNHIHNLYAGNAWRNWKIFYFLRKIYFVTKSFYWIYFELLTPTTVKRFFDTAANNSLKSLFLNTYF